MPSPPKSPAIGIRYISDVIKSDHRLLERIHASLVSPGAAGAPERHRALCQRLAWELARHIVAGELLVFPGTGRRAAQGSQPARERLRETAGLREEVRRLSEAAAGAAGEGEERLGAALRELGEHLGRHMRGVERFDLVSIEKALSGRESEGMARDFERTVFFIPHGVREEEDEEDEDGARVVEAPFGSVGALLDAGPPELRAAMERFPRGEGGDVRAVGGGDGAV